MYQSSTFVTTDEPTATCKLPKVLIVHSWCYRVYGLDKCKMTCIHDYTVTQNIFNALKIFCTPPIHPSPQPQFLATTDLFTMTIVLLSLECHVVGILKYVAFSDWLLSLRKVHLIFPHVIPGFDSSSLLALYNIPLPRCITVYLSVDLLKNILVAFQILSIMNKAVTNIYLEVLCVDISFQLLWVNAKDRIT